MSPTRAENAAGHQLDGLTVRLLAVLATGASTAEAAAACEVSTRRARALLAEARAAWQLPTTIELVVHAVRRRLI